MAISVTKPTVGGSEDTWGTTINTALDTIVDSVNGDAGTVSPNLSTLTINGADVTATAAEINVLDGVTATTAELNILDGVTATTAELNYVDGVTSSIQTQIDAKYEAATQTEALWEAGTGTTESLVSPAKVAAAIAAISSNAPDDGTVTEAKLADSAVSRAKLKTATNSAAYSFNDNGGSVTINLDPYSFFPSKSGGASASVGGNGSADNPAVIVGSSSSNSGTVAWRYIEA